MGIKFTSRVPVLKTGGYRVPAHFEFKVSTYIFFWYILLVRCIFIISVESAPGHLHHPRRPVLKQDHLWAESDRLEG